MGRNSSEGLQFKAVDMHVHSPASHDYVDKNVTPDDLIDAAIAAGLDAICVTDHNTAEWVDKLEAASEGTSVTVFPGVEISVTGGGKGPLHVIGIFDPTTTMEHLNDLLARIGLTADVRGEEDAVADGEPNDVIDAIFRHGGIPVLAHAGSTHGVLADMQGQPRLRVLRNTRLAAAETSDSKTRRFLDGTDATYKRKLPTYEASDAHCLADIGSKRSFFKVQALTLESLKQCFFDSEVRVLSESEHAACVEQVFPRLTHLSVRSGFFDGVDMHFHPCQNTLIGGQGVGKSLIVEFIRFALGRQSSVEAIQEDAADKLDAQLGIGGEITLGVALANGTEYEVARTYDGASNPISVVNQSTGESYEGDVTQLFPIVAYSQTEAIHIAREPQAQLELIDSFIDAAKYRNRLDELSKSLSLNDKAFADVLEVKEEIDELTTKLSTVVEEISNLEKSLSSAVLVAMKNAEDIQGALQGETDYLDALSSCVTALLDEIREDNPPPEIPETLATVECLSSANAVSVTAHDMILRELSAVVGRVGDAREQVETQRLVWAPDYQTAQEAYEEFLTKVGSDRRGLANRRKEAQRERERLETRLKRLQDKAKQLDRIRTEREESLDEVDRIRSSFREARQSKYKELAQLSEGKLRLELMAAGATGPFADALKQLVTGSKIRKSNCDKIASSMTPRDFVQVVLEGDVDELSRRSGVDSGNAEKLVSCLRLLDDQRSLLEILHRCVPEDVPIVKFRKDDGNHYPISRLSVGQKCTALLMIALVGGDYPIVIDQPEESIDIASVVEDIVSKLRAGKQSRQFILTTHNPNIAVSADSELIQVLKATATEGELVAQGAIEDERVRPEVVQHLEGGREPYLLRGRKYGLTRRFKA